jgi:uncharacterized NAD-dependent epimerase/dehydratase family protein
MTNMPEGGAIVYCEGAFNTPNGKTAHGLVRFTVRYDVLAVVDSAHAGSDAGEVLDGSPNGIPVVAGLKQGMEAANAANKAATHMVVGLAPDGGRLSPAARADVKKAIELGLNVDSGLHDFLSDDPAFVKLAATNGIEIRDVRKPPGRDKCHFFSGKIEEVTSVKVALLGTDSAVGKRTTAWKLVTALHEMGYTAELVGTGQTAWLQGARYSIMLDSLINDFVTGELEHAVHSAWSFSTPDVIVIEGQGSLLNPAYPGGFEIIAATRPDAIVLQHAPARRDYDGFPGYPIQPLAQQIDAVEKITGQRNVVAITVNHEDLPKEDIDCTCRAIHMITGLPVADPLMHTMEPVLKALRRFIER